MQIRQQTGKQCQKQQRAHTLISQGLFTVFKDTPTGHIIMNTTRLLFYAVIQPAKNVAEM